tara:strand:- start:70 stop:459 length:390 start_codon:yes stop_codon:yes gene_type:complete
MEKQITLTLYTNGESYIYKPNTYDGYLFLNYDDQVRNIFYKFIDGNIGTEFTKLENDKQTSLSLYNMFYKYINNEQDIEVYNLSEHDESELNEYSELLENNELEEIFGYEYDEDEDSHKVKSLLEFNIE